MKKLLLIVGIVLLAACIFSLLFAALNRFGYYRTLDGSAALYARLHRRMILFFVLGIVFAAVGTGCLIVRSKL